MGRKKEAPAPEPDPQPDYFAEQLAALADRVAELENQVANAKQGIAAHLGISV